jgi:hypothetical protein
MQWRVLADNGIELMQDPSQACSKSSLSALSLSRLPLRAVSLNYPVVEPTNGRPYSTF